MRRSLWQSAVWDCVPSITSCKAIDREMNEANIQTASTHSIFLIFMVLF